MYGMVLCIKNLVGLLILFTLWQILSVFLAPKIIAQGIDFVYQRKFCYAKSPY